MSIAELAAMVSGALEAAELDAVLSGGSVVSIYSDNEYQSFDLDFVTLDRMKALAAALVAVMDSLGFRRSTWAPFCQFEHAVLRGVSNGTSHGRRQSCQRDCAPSNTARSRSLLVA
jgi:hypothetical protein